MASRRQIHLLKQDVTIHAPAAAVNSTKSAAEDNLEGVRYLG